MPSNKETLFQEHIAKYLKNRQDYTRVQGSEISDKDFHIIEAHLLQFIKETQADTWQSLEENFGSDAPRELLKALKQETLKRPLWLIMRSGLTIRGFKFQLYYPKPRSTTSEEQEELYKRNKLSFKTEYRYNKLSEERIDLVIWLNGLPIVVMELKHEDEGQDVNDAIFDSFLTRELSNRIYKDPFLYVALSNTQAKMATNPGSEKNFRWFNAGLQNRAETLGEYPVEHIYRHVLSKGNITGYLENFLVFVPAEEKIDENGELQKKDSYTIFPRYHQFRASKNLAADVKEFVNENLKLGKKYLINHSAGAGKTLTIAWMADLLDGLYSASNKKVFDNIIILTDRTSLDKNIKDDLEKFSHLTTKLNFAKLSRDLAEFLEKDRDIIVSTIHKFSYIQEKLQNDAVLKHRNVAFLIDEAHRSQDGKLSVTMKEYFTSEEEDGEDEELDKLNLSNQIFVAFTATTTAKTVSYFGEPFDVYSEEEAIEEGYILDVANNIISYETLYNLQLKEAIPEKDFPHGTVSKLLRNIAYEDEEIIQYKSEVIVKYFEEKVKESVAGKGKAMVVASSRLAGLIYFNTIKTILEEKEAQYNVLYAFSDFTHPRTNKKITEDAVNRLTEIHGGKEIEDVFNLPEYRIMVVANKFQTGFDQPLLSAMFLDKSIRDVNAIQTVSRLNRKHPDKEQEEILVVDFTNNSTEIFAAFNKYRAGSPFKEKEPNKEILVELYREIRDFGAFNEEDIELYINAYLDAEEEARKRNSTADAILSDLDQQYRAMFKQRLPILENQKKYVSLLRRYEKLYYFISQFFKLEEELHEFTVFAAAMGNKLIRKGKTSEMKQFLKKVELHKGAVRYKGTAVNTRPSNEAKKTGLKLGGSGEGPVRSTIEAAVAQLTEKFPISDQEALVIREICKEVSQNYEIREKVVANKHNEIYLKTSARPRISKEVKKGYIKRNLTDKLEEDVYKGQGGIIYLMGRTIIESILGRAS